ncbi:hypothetical protein AS159_05210 [Thermotoga sp. Ku-13t]|uniref:hypothetical protein n=1 Tax=Thermotoga sp. Ku-13t TaxID=1755813 RepID=UPI0013EB8F1A|nr:hypothetical protein [Thermotoga sp. Ku-13t]KAF2957806.1 hypothetical protein AS159_05210 [Thermotoga sp. Ku-13t]
MAYFRVNVEVGHLGSGRSMTLTRHIRARDAVDAYRAAKFIPRVKRVNAVEPVENLEDLALGLLNDVKPVWFFPRTATEIVILLIRVAFELAGAPLQEERPAQVKL